MKAILVGSSGLIGGELLKLLEADSDFTEVIALIRKKSQNSNAKIKETIVDFEAIPTSIFQGIDVVFCCLGTTIGKAGSKEAFEKVDYQYPLEIAKIAFENGVKKYEIVTALGSSAQSSIYYNQVKGRVEEALAAIGFESLGIFRPSMLLGDRQEFRLGEKIGKAFMQAFAFLIPDTYKAIHASKVAEAMIDFAKTSNNGCNIIESKAML